MSNKKDKHPICEVLGVDVEQPFKMKGTDIGFYVDKDGLIRREGDDPYIGLPEICLMINNPDLIIRKRSWTNQDVEDAKAMMRIFRDGFNIWVERGLSSEDIFVGWEGDCNSFECNINPELLPSLKRGQSAKLSEIIGKE